VGRCIYFHRNDRQLPVPEFRCPIYRRQAIYCLVAAADVTAMLLHTDAEALPMLAIKRLSWRPDHKQARHVRPVVQAGDHRKISDDVIL
jgi:hypothetical protein